MNKLLDAFKTCNSLNNAKKLANHARKHPMVFCMLTTDDAHILKEAINLAERN